MNDSAGLIVAVVSILLAVCALTVTTVGLRRKTDDDHTTKLERRVEELEAQNIQQARDIDDCKRGKAEMNAQNFALLLELHELRKKVGEA